MSEMSFHWLNLSGRNYVVTGAASGIGLAVAQSLVRVGAHVALLDRDRAGAERAARQEPMAPKPSRSNATSPRSRQLATQVNVCGANLEKFRAW